MRDPLVVIAELWGDIRALVALERAARERGLVRWFAISEGRDPAPRESLGLAVIGAAMTEAHAGLSGEHVRSERERRLIFQCDSCDAAGRASGRIIGDQAA